MNNIITNKEVLKYFIDNYGINKTISKTINGKIHEIDRLNLIDILKTQLNSEEVIQKDNQQYQMNTTAEKLKQYVKNTLEEQKQIELKRLERASLISKIINYKSKEIIEDKFNKQYDKEMIKIDNSMKQIDKTQSSYIIDQSWYDTKKKEKLYIESYNEYSNINEELDKIYINIKHDKNTGNIDKRYIVVIDIEITGEIIFKIYDENEKLNLDNKKYYNIKTILYIIENKNIEINFNILKIMDTDISDTYNIKKVINYYLYSYHINLYLNSKYIYHINNYSENLNDEFNMRNNKSKSKYIINTIMQPINENIINEDTIIKYILIEINNQVYLIIYNLKKNLIIYNNIDNIILLLKIHYNERFINYDTIKNNIIQQIDNNSIFIIKNTQNENEEIYILYLKIKINEEAKLDISSTINQNIYTYTYNPVITSNIHQNTNINMFVNKYLTFDSSNKSGGRNKKFKVFYNQKNKKYYINYNNRKQYLSYKNIYKDNKNGKFYMKIKNYELEIYI